MPIRIDATTLPALIFGSVLLVLAIISAVAASRTRKSLDPASEADDSARLHANRQYRRRLQVSAMLGIVGILIPLGDQMDKFFLARPGLFLVWLCSIFVLVIWMVLMALGDWLSTFAYSAIERSHLRHQRSELEEEIRRYHASRNGHSHSIDDGDDSHYTSQGPE